MWNRVLSSSIEIPKLAEGRTNAISTGRTLRWTGYLTFAGVQIMRPSTASDAGQTEGKCTPFLDQYDFVLYSSRYTSGRID